MRRTQASGPAETIYTEGMADSAKPVPHKILGKKVPLFCANPDGSRPWRGVDIVPKELTLSRKNRTVF
jgi:hypothetical protein